MATQSKITVSLGMGDDGLSREKVWKNAAKSYGYRQGLGTMVREIVDAVIKTGVWGRRKKD